MYQDIQVVCGPVCVEGGVGGGVGGNLFACRAFLPLHVQ